PRAPHPDPGGFKPVDNSHTHWNNRGISKRTFPNPSTRRSHATPSHSGEPTMAYTQSQLLAMSQPDLDDLFSKSSAGDIPDGEAQGTAIIAPGTKFSPEIASLINI